MSLVLRFLSKNVQLSHDDKEVFYIYIFVISIIHTHLQEQ